MRTSTSAIVASVLVCGIAVIACAKADDNTGFVTDTPKTEPTPDAGAKKKDAGSTSGTKPGTSTSSSSGGGSSSGGSSGTGSSSGSSGSGNGMCISEVDFNSCIDCCSTAHPTGSDTFYGTLIDCLCQTSHCASDCAASLCNASNPTAPDATCDTCVQGTNGSSACQSDVQTACSADADCIAFDQCVSDSDCANKP